MPYEIGEAPSERTVNGFFCMGCNSLLLSLFTHDYKVCECGNMVDGGSSYARRGFKSFEAYRQVVEIFDWSGILVAAEIGLAQQLGKYSEPIKFMRDEGIQKLIDQERLIFTKDAEEPEGGAEELGLTVMSDRHSGENGFTEEELVRAKATKEATDMARAAEIFAKVRALSSGGENN